MSAQVLLAELDAGLQDISDRIGALVVDDDPMVRNLLRLALDQAGFAVWLAADGTEALAVYAKEQESIDVVLLDVCMPGLDGPQTLAALRRQNPTVRACFMSGNTGAYSEAELLRHGAALMITKPFHLPSLTDALRRVSHGLPVGLRCLEPAHQA